MPESPRNISRMKLATERGALVFGEVIYPPGGTCGPRVQPDYELVVIHRGALELQLDGRRIEVPAGHAILLAPGHREHYLFSRDSQTHHSWCAISPSAAPAEIDRTFDSIGIPAPFSSQLASLLKLAKTLPADHAAGRDLANGCGLGFALALVFGFAMAVQARPEVKSSAEEALARLDSYISREYAKPLQLADLATAACVSRQHLMKLCRDRGRPTPMRSLYEKRLEVAADHLVRTGLTIGEIASRCGFANAFHFSRMFSHAYGQSPRAWRTQAWSRPATKRVAEGGRGGRE